MKLRLIAIAVSGVLLAACNQPADDAARTADTGDAAAKPDAE